MKSKSAVHHTEAIFSEDESYRFDLQWRWADGPILVGWLLNPSTATEILLDRSVSRIMRESHKLGLGGFRIINLYAFRSKDPKRIQNEPSEVRLANERHTSLVLAEAVREGWPIVAGWGEDGWQRQARALTIAHQANAVLHHFGDLTKKNGCPRHPARLSDDRKLSVWQYQPPEADRIFHSSVPAVQT